MFNSFKNEQHLTRAILLQLRTCNFDQGHRRMDAKPILIFKERMENVKFRARTRTQAHEKPIFLYNSEVKLRLYLYDYFLIMTTYVDLFRLFLLQKAHQNSTSLCLCVNRKTSFPSTTLKSNYFSNKAFWHSAPR